MVLGDSQANKNRIQLLTFKKFEKDVDNDNEADAFCMHKMIEFVVRYFEERDFEYKYHKKAMNKIVFRLIKLADMLESRRVKNSKDKYVTKYFYNDKKVASLKGLLRYNDDLGNIYEEAYKKFKELYKIGD